MFSPQAGEANVFHRPDPQELTFARVDPPQELTFARVDPPQEQLTFERSHTPEPPQLSGSSDAVPLTAEQKRKKKRDRVAHEILETEEKYVASLESLVKLYLKPLRQRGSVIPKDKIEVIFGNLEHILIINRELLDSLRKRMEQWETNDSLGDVMNKLIPWLQLYSDYCAKHHNSTAVVQKLLEKPAVAEVLKDISHTNNVLDLSSLLIMPIQRIPRYKLLVEELIKNTPEQHPDYEELNNALEKIKSVAIVINESCHKQHNLEQLMELEEKLTGALPKDFVQPARKLIHEGDLTKLCRKTPKKRYFLLFNNLIMYGEKSLLGEVKIHRSIDLYSAKIQAVPDCDKTKNAFEIKSKEKSFVAWADSPEEKAIWEDKIEEANKSRRDIINLRDVQGDDQWFAPTWQHDGDLKFCPLCFSRFTTIRRKHHCRRCGTLSCAKCSNHQFELPNIGKERVCDDCYNELSGKKTKMFRLRERIKQNMDGEEEQPQVNGDFSMGIEISPSPSLPTPQILQSSPPQHDRLTQVLPQQNRLTQVLPSQQNRLTQVLPSQQNRLTQVLPPQQNRLTQVLPPQQNRLTQVLPQQNTPPQPRQAPSTAAFDKFRKKPLPTPPGNSTPALPTIHLSPEQSSHRRRNSTGSSQDVPKPSRETLVGDVPSTANESPPRLPPSSKKPVRSFGPPGANGASVSMIIPNINAPQQSQFGSSVSMISPHSSPNVRTRFTTDLSSKHTSTSALPVRNQGGNQTELSPPQPPPRISPRNSQNNAASNNSLQLPFVLPPRELPTQTINSVQPVAHLNTPQDATIHSRNSAPPHQAQKPFRLPSNPNGLPPRPKSSLCGPSSVSPPVNLPPRPNRTTPTHNTSPRSPPARNINPQGPPSYLPPAPPSERQKENQQHNIPRPSRSHPNMPARTLPPNNRGQYIQNRQSLNQLKRMKPPVRVPPSNLS